jgi:hypothetical protein
LTLMFTAIVCSINSEHCKGVNNEDSA